MPLAVVAATSTVTAAEDLPDSSAVTVLTPPFSLMDACDSARLTVGVPSSSVIVSVFEVGLATPPPFAVPATVTDVFGASTSLFVAVIVTVPVELVDPAAIVSRLLVESV